jgi:hypothetical protein
MPPYIHSAILVLLVGALVLGCVVGAVTALWRWRGGWRWVAGLPLLYVIAVGLKIFVEVSADPTAHNLWPFEVLGAALLAGAVLAGLWLLRFLAGRWVGRERLT